MMAKISSQKQNLGEAYDLVIADLFSKLTKIKTGIIKLGDLGILSKREREIRSPANGKVYVYFQVSFKASNLLKKELDKQL
jgi:nucleoid DNA-binding protein